ncbi:MAG TPA: 1-acyl-sn-glycerol-3-phosphate acyltransferase, partial [Mesotoga sp.]|nr:1-acyl-sn-glycerol-3-phosphate acyltransferase [Mesotoga sp.]
FKGRKRASGIERIVWFCDKCGGFRTIAARGDEAVCAECGAALAVDEYGYISGKSVPEVLKVQGELLAAYLSREGSLKVGPGEAVILNTLTEGIVKVRGEVSIDGLELKVGERSYRLENARGFSTYLKRLNEFNYDRDVIRLKTEHSSYLLYCAYRILAGPEAATL